MNEDERDPRPGMGRGAARLKIAAEIVAAAWLATSTPALAQQEAAGSSLPLSTAWNIASSGKASSSGELLFRVTPADGEDPVEVSVFVLSGSNETGIASSIRRAMSTQLDSSRFDIEIGQGANVLVTTEAGKATGYASPGFALELLDSDVENVRVMVRSAAQATPPADPGAQVPEAIPPASPNTPPPDTPVNPTPPTTTPPGSTPGPGGGEGADAPPPPGSTPLTTAS